MRCPFCAEPLDDEAAARCPSCGEALGEREATASSGSGAVKIVLVVVAVVVLGGLLCAFAGGFLFFRAQKQMRGQMQRARVQADLQALLAACELFKLDTGGYPASLNDLVSQPPGAAVWNGPYLGGPGLPADPWGNPFDYRIEGNAHVLTSYGADGAPGGSGDAADISRRF